MRSNMILTGIPIKRELGTNVRMAEHFTHWIMATLETSTHSRGAAVLDQVRPGKMIAALGSFGEIEQLYANAEHHQKVSFIELKTAPIVLSQKHLLNLAKMASERGEGFPSCRIGPC